MNVNRENASDDIRLPYHRIYRPMAPSFNSGYSGSMFMRDHEYSCNPEAYTRAFIYIQKDIVELFEYIEPADKNLKTYSHKIQQLLTRCCVEIEANFKAILKENIYTKKDEHLWTIKDYKLINTSHHLDQYLVLFPIWNGSKNTFIPFEEWKETNKPLHWYDAYNKAKHSRQSNMQKANFSNLLYSFSALFVLLTAQFGSESFEPGVDVFCDGGGDSYYKGVNFGIGDYLGITYPSDWKEEEKYNFNWTDLKEHEIRFRKFNYDELCE